MNKRITMFVIAGLMLCLASYGQVVVVGGNGEAIIDCSGMNPNYYTTIRKPHTPTGTNLADDLGSAMNDAKVYKRFEVSKTDERQTSFGYYAWPIAITLCANKSGGGWRLPTKRDLLLMWVLKPELEVLSDPFDIVRGNYWTATSNSSDRAILVDFRRGSGASGLKRDIYSVRCVRDL